MRCGTVGSSIRVAALALSLWLAAGGPAVAQTDAGALFTVRNVAVDVTAATATLAREQAVREGQRRALGLLLRRLTRKADAARLPVADDALAGAALQDFEVGNERISAVRYLANMTFNFNAAEIRRALRQAGIAYSETQSKPVIVVPVLAEIQDGQARLWDDPNPWRDAWTRLPARDGLLPLSAPVGDIGDINALTTDEALAGDAEALGRLATRYGTTDAYVLLAEMLEMAPAPVVTVSGIRVGSSGGDLPATRIDGAPGETLEAFLPRAAAAIADALEDAWIGATLLRFGEQRQIAAQVPMNSLADWVDVRSRLARAAIVAQIQVTAMRRDRVELVIDVLGEADQLRQALVQVDLDLEQGPNGAILRRRPGQ